MGQNLNDAKVKNEIAAQVLPLIEDLPTPIERDTYRQALARMLRVDENSLVAAPIAGRGAKRRSRAVSQPRSVEPASAAAINPTLKIESYCLGVLLHKPVLLYRVDRTLQEFGLSALAAEDFEYTDHQLLFGVVREAVEQDEKEHHHFVMTHLPETISDVSMELLQYADALDPVDDKLIEELLSRFIDLRRMNAMSSVNQLRFLQEDEQQSGGENIKTYQEQAMQFTKLLHGLDQAKRRIFSKR